MDRMAWLALSCDANLWLSIFGWLLVRGARFCEGWEGGLGGWFCGMREGREEIWRGGWGKERFDSMELVRFFVLRSMRWV